MRQVGVLEQMYQDYREAAEFRMIYIREAHAEDGRSPVPYAKELGIVEHKNFGQRCDTAKRLLDDHSLTIPCLADGMDDAVNQAYRAWPDRIFVVRKDGRLAVAASRGPWGFEPALQQSLEWLKKYQTDGIEPELPAEVKESDQD